MVRKEFSGVQIEFQSRFDFYRVRGFPRPLKKSNQQNLKPYLFFKLLKINFLIQKSNIEFLYEPLKNLLNPKHKDHQYHLYLALMAY